jgi:hypothetical protein
MTPQINVRSIRRWKAAVKWLGTSVVIVAVVAFVDPFLSVTVTKIAAGVLWIRCLLRDA